MSETATIMVKPRLNNLLWLVQIYLTSTPNLKISAQLNGGTSNLIMGVHKQVAMTPIGMSETSSFNNTF